MAYTPAIRHPGRLEEIIHEVLSPQRLTYSCKHCGKRHKEWFEVTLERAEEVVLLWTRWMQLGPYQGRSATGLCASRLYECMGSLHKHIKAETSTSSTRLSYPVVKQETGSRTVNGTPAKRTPKRKFSDYSKVDTISEDALERGRILSRAFQSKLSATYNHSLAEGSDL